MALPLDDFMVRAALAGLADGSLKPMAQPEGGDTYANKLSAADQPIDWSKPAAEVDCQIRGLSPFPGAICHWTPEGEAEPVRLKLLMSEATGASGGAAPGTVLDDRLLVACGDGGAVRISQLQRPGKGPMTAAVFLNGTPIAPGTVLS